MISADLSGLKRNHMRLSPWQDPMQVYPTYQPLISCDHWCKRFKSRGILSLRGRKGNGGFLTVHCELSKQKEHVHQGRTVFLRVSENLRKQCGGENVV